ncbi:MAG: hypothetical protein IKV28_06205 [Bacteroidales bacterium]|nr:hypothetical protein [Bacteroidales bacterium]
MITRMTKYSFIVLSQELDSFLNKVQELGMVDITRSDRAIDDASREQFNTARRFREAVRNIQKAPENAEKSTVTPVTPTTPNHELLSYVEGLFQEQLEQKEIYKNLQREYADSAAWGEFNPEDLERLQRLGFGLKFYCVAAKRYNPAWEETWPIQILAKSDSQVRFAVAVPSDQMDEAALPLSEAHFPDTPASVLAARLQATEARMGELSSLIAGLTQRIPDLEAEAAIHQEELDRYLAQAAVLREGEDAICVLEGFAPTENDAALKAFFDGTDAYYEQEAACAEDNPPVKLKNNFFSRLFEPIGDLYMLPNYGELDVTPYFAPFYMLFFGLCLGDMGYGLVMMLAGGLISWKVPSFRGYANLVILLGLGAILMPVLSGTFFGAKIYDIIEFPQNIREFFFSDLKMFWFAIIFGIFHIIAARLINVIYLTKTKGLKYGLANLGWILVIIWCTFAYAGSQMGQTLLPATIGTPMALIGLALILFFSKTEGNIISRLFGGVTALYDITGVFGDVLSYIRLFGLGTAGGILGLVVNSIALQMTGIPYIGWGLTIIVLIIGHIAVLGLSCLGAFVHPLRLTFVEFYKNVGFEGGGRAYRPLKKEQNKQ